MTASDSDPSRTLHWPHGRAELQRLGGMLAPVVFRADGARDFAPMQVAPWADESGADALPGILRRLRGEWPCVPFGRCDRPAGLPEGWGERDPGDHWGHGYAAHHDWQWIDTDDPLTLALQIEPPAPLRRLTRTVRARADAPALELTLAIEVQQACTLPIALHPTLRLNAGAARLQLPAHCGGVTYPVPAEPGISRLAPDRSFADLAAVPLATGGTLDLSRFPLPIDTEELLQLHALDAPVVLHYLDAGWALQIDWDHALLPDLMLWVSHRGRRHAPWNGRHLALGVEPVNGPFDLGRVADAPGGHLLANRGGLSLAPGAPLRIAYRLAARPQAAA
jgi:hypothetical protein